MGPCSWTRASNFKTRPFFDLLAMILKSSNGGRELLKTIWLKCVEWFLQYGMAILIIRLSFYRHSQVQNRAQIWDGHSLLLWAFDHNVSDLITTYGSPCTQHHDYHPPLSSNLSLKMTPQSTLHANNSKSWEKKEKVGGDVNCDGGTWFLFEGFNWLVMSPTQRKSTWH